MRKRWLILLLCASLLNLPSMAYAKKHKPTLAQIEAAKKVETEKKKVADAAAAKLASANQTLRTLTVKANTARTLYLKARNELAIATAQAIAAASHAQATAAAVSAAHRTIGQLAANAGLCFLAYAIEGRFSNDAQRRRINQRFLMIWGFIVFSLLQMVSYQIVV